MGSEYRPALSRVSGTREALKKLEQLAAWHRLQAELAGSEWIWEARVRTAEGLEQRAADIRKLLPTVLPRRLGRSGYPEDVRVKPRR